MININDNNRDNLIASCLIEAANVMSESYGAHGLMEKALKEKLKTIPDSKEKQKTIEQYKKAGYRDKIPEKFKIDDKDIKDYIDTDNYIRKIQPNKTTDSAVRDQVNRYNSTMYARKTMKEKAKYLNKQNEKSNSTVNDIAKRISSKEHENATNTSDVNRRINRRAKKVMGESVEKHLEFANLLLED